MADKKCNKAENLNYLNANKIWFQSKFLKILNQDSLTGNVPIG